MSSTTRTGTEPDCGKGHDSPTLRVADALAIVMDHVRPITDVEPVKIRDALGRVLAGDVHSPIDVPGYDNSAMDGYALAAHELPESGATSLRVAGTAWAGRPFSDAVGPGECVRIMTGAPVPAGADMVVMQEHVERVADQISVPGPPRPGANIRRAGEDIAANAVAVAAGTRLDPAHLGLLASIGQPECDVLRRPRVSFFSTGDELRQVGDELAGGQIYDSNRYTLHGMLTRAGVDVVDLGVISDSQDALTTAFRDAGDSDIIITSGGVSVGDADHVAGVFGDTGRILFGSVALKPGRPVVFGTRGDALFFGLPGNPVSVMATFYTFVRPALWKLSGTRGPDPVLTIDAVSRSAFRTRRGRRELLRGILTATASGYEVEPAGEQGSGRLSSMGLANCFIVIDEEREDVESGSIVRVQPFASFV